MSVIPEEQLRVMPYIFRQNLLDSPRALPAELGRKAGVSRVTAKRYLSIFIKERILFPPQMRLKIGKEIVEYVYLSKVDDPYSFFSILREQKWIFYGCTLVGPFNLIFMSYQPVDLTHLKGYRYTIMSGIRSNYYVPNVTKKSYDTAYNNILRMCEGKIEPSLFDVTQEDINWTEELWELYCDLKHNLRKDFTPLVKKYGFKSTTFYQRYHQLLANTDVYVPFYPLGERKYQFFYYLFKTKYQRFVADCLGQLPVSTTHIRIKDSLLSYVPVPYEEEREHFLNIISLWERKGIIDSCDLSLPYYSDLIGTHPGIPLPAPPVPSPSGIIPPDRKEGNTGKEFMYSI